MPKVTFEITPKQRKLMDKHPDVNWSEVFRRTVEQEARRQELARRIERELTDKDVEEVATLVNNELRRRWLEEFGPGRR
jgi:DNA-binding MarR family transcriptional regulator